MLIQISCTLNKRMHRAIHKWVNSDTPHGGVSFMCFLSMTDVDLWLRDFLLTHSRLCCAESTFLLAISLLVCTRFDLVVFVDPIQYAPVHRFVRSGKFEPISSYLSEYRCLAQCVDEDSVWRNSPISQSLLELVSRERTSLQSHPEDVDCLDMIPGYECVLSHGLVLLFRVEYDVECVF